MTKRLNDFIRKVEADTKREASELGLDQDDQLLLAVFSWWRMKRPIAHSMTQHLANPAVNCHDSMENKLALALMSRIKNV